jgi:ribosomal protein L37AE/L43A
MLSMLGKLRAPWWVCLLAGVLVLAFLPVALLVDAVLLFVRVVRVDAYIAQTDVKCPRGHVVRARDESSLWSCASCGFNYVGSGFAPCPQCEAISAFIQCSCGASVRNTVWDELGDRDAR